MNGDSGVPDLVNWYEGMLLLPEHFQNAARRQETLVPYLTFAAAPCGWGIKTLETRLDNGVFEVTRLEAIMPDGLLVDFPGPGGVDAASEPKALELNLNKLAEPLPVQTIYLVVPRWTDDALSLGGQRYHKSGGPALAQSDPLYPPVDPKDADHPWLRPTLALRAIDNPALLPDKFVRLALARVRRREQRFDLERFQPPRFQVGEDEPVYDLAAKVAAKLREEAKKFYERLPSRAVADASPPPAPKIASRMAAAVGSPGENSEDRLLKALRLLDQQARLLDHQARMHDEQVRSLQAKVVLLERQADAHADLQALAQSLPRLEALLAARPHPYRLYLALCDVIGSISVLRGELALLDSMPVYDHADMLPSFERMVVYIWTILDKINLRYRKVYFKSGRIGDRSGEYTLDLTLDALGVPAGEICQSEGTARFFILGAVIGEGRDHSAVVKWMNQAIIATRQNLERQLLGRVMGAERTAIADYAPLDLKAPPWTLLYRVYVRDDNHAIDLSAGPLIVRNDDGPGAPDQIILYLPTGPGAAAS